MAEDKGMEPVDEGMAVVPDAPLADVPTIIPELEDVVSQLATDVSFARKTWKDGSEGATPITAAELNRLEKGVADLTSAVNGLRDSVSQALLCTGIGITGDFDNCTKAGAYIVSADSGSSMGFPSGAYKWGTLIVFARQGKYIIQIYIADSVNEPVYMRNAFDGSTFRNWTKIARTSM